ncbi:MAG: hypothetical protein ACOC2U_00880 [bacterium]
MNFLQQGDVLIKKIEKLPKNKNEVKRKKNGYILADGEVTGHAHRIDDDIDLFENNNVLYMKNDHEVTLTHEEHGDVQIPDGIWQIGIVQEYDHFAEVARQIAD